MATLIKDASTINEINDVLKLRYSVLKETGSALNGLFSSTGKVSDFSVIGDRDPLGFCGSGLVDLLSELRINRVIDEVGVFQENLKWM